MCNIILQSHLTVKKLIMILGPLKGCGWRNHTLWGKFTTNVLPSGHTVKKKKKKKLVLFSAIGREASFALVSGHYGDSEMFKMLRRNDWRVLNPRQNLSITSSQAQGTSQKRRQKNIKSQRWGLWNVFWYSTILAIMNTQHPETSGQDWVLQHWRNGEMGQGVYDLYQELWLGTNCQGGWKRGQGCSRYHFL